MTTRSLITSTMQDDFPLTITAILRHGTRGARPQRVRDLAGRPRRRRSYAETARATRGLPTRCRAGHRAGDRVATLCWNNRSTWRPTSPCRRWVRSCTRSTSGCSAEQVIYIINHAEDSRDRRRIAAAGAREGAAAAVVRADVHRHRRRRLRRARGGPRPPYEDGAGRRVAVFPWPEVDERSAAHVLHQRHDRQPEGCRLLAPLELPARDVGLARRCRADDRTMLVRADVPRQCMGYAVRGVHVRCGSGDARTAMHAEPLVGLIEAEQVTLAAVPTIWNAILQLGQTPAIDLSSLRTVMCGGSAVPRALIAGVPGVRDQDHPGLGDDRDLAGCGIAKPPMGVTGRGGAATPPRRRAGCRRASRAGSSTTPAR